MRSRRWLLLPLLALLTAARPVLAASCCTYLNPTVAQCDETDCQNCVAACDPPCVQKQCLAPDPGNPGHLTCSFPPCTTDADCALNIPGICGCYGWDFQCSQEAQGIAAACPAHQCDGVCNCPTPPPTPTPGGPTPGPPTPTFTPLPTPANWCCEIFQNFNWLCHAPGTNSNQDCRPGETAVNHSICGDTDRCVTWTPTTGPTATRTSTFTKTPTPTRVPPTATRTPGPGRCEAVPICYPGPPTPTPTGACPFSFTDATGDLGSTCLFTGIYNTSCLSQIVPLDGYFAGNGRNLTIAFSTQPTVSWTGRAISGNTATLQGYKIGGGALVVYPATATLAGTPAHPVLTITLGGQTIPYNLCAFPQGCTADESCPFGAYIGQFNQVISPILPPPAQYLSPVPATQ